jgi:Uncharacterised protein conserved in bacteria (DUF2336)
MRKSFLSPTLDGLVDLACRDGVDIRPTLLRVLTDLYVQKPTHSPDEEVQYIELASGLIDAVDAPTRAAVAARLAAYPAAPAAIRRRLGGIPPAADAPRPGETKPEPDLADLFFAAGAEERRLILINLDAALPSAAPRRPAVSGDVIGRLETAALQRSTHEFCRTLERALGISRALTERIVRDPSGEPIVVAARAIGMKAAVLQRILLFLNPQVGQSVQRVYELARLYDELTPAAAERMLTIWRQTGGSAKPRHEPLHWDDEQRNARSQATHAGHRVARGRDVRSSRLRSNER